MSHFDTTVEPVDPVVVGPGLVLTPKRWRKLVKGATGDRSVWCSGCQAPIVWQLRGEQMVAVCLDCDWAAVSGVSEEFGGEDGPRQLRCIAASHGLDDSTWRCRMHDVDPLTMLCPRHARKLAEQIASRKERRRRGWLD